MKLRLPARPDDAAGWVAAAHAVLSPTSWRIVVSLASRALTVYDAGVAARRIRVVVGASATPTPTGIFSIIDAWRAPPSGFVGSWVLTLSAHSNVLRTFDGGDGRVAIHGRGGASLRAPLGSADSHGCIRLANAAIDWLVKAIGAELPGTPVLVQAG